MKDSTKRMMMLAGCILVAGLCLTGCPVPPTVPATDIPPQLNAESIPAFAGTAAVAAPIAAPEIPQNPHMADNDTSAMHNDTYMSDTYRVAGPLGKSPEVRNSFLGGVCVSMCFDQAGRILTISLGLRKTRLWLVDPVTLAPWTSLDLPVKPYVEGSFPSGGYFVLDNKDRALLPTIDRTVWVVETKETSCGPRFEVKRIYDLTGAVTDMEDQIGSVVPDFNGLIWFVTDGGIIGTIDPDDGTVSSIALAGEGIANSFSIDETGGVYIASTHALYRLDADDSGLPVITWREEYDRGSAEKPGQHSHGSGTTPTLMGADYVTICDNAEPNMNVLVYKRAADVTGNRLVLKQPVFAEGKSASENSLIATNTSIVVENNYGYYGPAAALNGHTTEPGITRIDLIPGGGGGQVAWISEERVPNVVSKMSLATGLVYSYCKDPGPNVTDAWYFTAIDFATGDTVFKQLAGTGHYFNSHYAGLYIGPDGTLYCGVIGGLVAMRDTQ